MCFEIWKLCRNADGDSCVFKVLSVRRHALARVLVFLYNTFSQNRHFIQQRIVWD